MADRQNVSLLAFLQEISNWELTLSRQSKKLKSLRQSCSNKLKLNTIEIVLTQIESELIQYKKAKDRVIHYLSRNQLIHKPQQNSIRFCPGDFINLMEKVGETFGGEGNETLILDNTQIELVQVGENICPNKMPKRFLDQTFSYSISKEPPRKKSSFTHHHPNINSLLGQTSYNQDRKKKNNKSYINSVNLSKSKNPTKKKISTLQQLQSQEQKDLWDIRYQLKEIKSMMTQMGNQIKYHNHQEIEKEINKIEHTNKKLSLQLKSLKEDNQFMLTRLQNIKQDVAQQKKAQIDMIKQFQQGKDHSRSNFHELSKSKEDLAQEYTIYQ